MVDSPLSPRLDPSVPVPPGHEFAPGADDVMASPHRLSWLRVPHRIVIAASVSIASAAILTLCRPIGAISRPALLAVRRFVYRSWGNTLCWVLGVRVETVGQPPTRPFLLVSNHLSYLDIPLLASIRPARYVAKVEISSWPLVGWMCRSVDTVFVDRSSRRDVVRVAQEMRRALDEGDGVVLFAEGTSTRGDAVAPFQAPLLASASRTGEPVHAVAVRYEVADDQVPADRSVSWWGGMPFGSHIIQLLRLPRIDARVTYAPNPATDQDRKQLARALQAQVEELFEPMTDQPTFVAAEHDHPDSV